MNELKDMLAGIEVGGTVSKTVDGVEMYIAAEDGQLITGTRQDCTPILEDAKARHAAGAIGSSEMRHAARLPMAIIEQYCNTNGITFREWMTDPAHLRRMLTDPDLSGFRIWDGKNGGIRSVGGFEQVVH